MHDHQDTSFLTVVGNVKQGDLVYQLDNQGTVVLRRSLPNSTSRFLMVAVGSNPERIGPTSAALSRPGNVDFPDRVYIDFENPRGCCSLFCEELTRQKWVREYWDRRRAAFFQESKANEA